MKTLRKTLPWEGSNSRPPQCDAGEMIEALVQAERFILEFSLYYFNYTGY
jgi:hypothetical protein